MKKILLCILGFFIIILQNSIINYLSVFGMTINIVLIYLVIISLYLDELESGIIGAVLGIILDSSVGGLFGSNGLIFFGVAYMVSYIKDKVYIAPVFKNGIITIVTCDNCGPNFGKEVKYKISPLEKPAKMIKVCNFTSYDIIISMENAVIQRIESNNKRNEKCHSKFVGIPLNGIIYIDTVSEEITWKDDYGVREAAILRVNGCCIKINNGSCSECISVIGPELSEPYIRHLYASFRRNLKYEGDVNIRCNTIDYRID